jgi:hypothetical protein
MKLSRKAFLLVMVVAPLFGLSPVISPLAAASPSTFRPKEPPPQPDSTQCSFALSPPQPVVLPGGARAVTATLDTSTCSGSAAPTDVIVCVATPDGPGNCKKTPGWSRAQVYVTSSRSGTFTATGQGCWRDLLVSFREDCQNTGPLTATL